MEANLATFGGSIVVPYVQEVAKESLKTVPKRYVQPDQDPPFTSYATSPLDIPIIDMERLLCGDNVMLELQKLDSACKEWGFFQLINHGVRSSLLDKVKLEIQEFFNLPMEEKKKLRQQHGDIDGYGQTFVVSEEQILDWGDMFYLTTLPTHLRKPHIFPMVPLPLRETIEAYAVEVRNLTLKIFDLQARALKINPEDLMELFKEGMQSIRMNYYPPCPQPEKVIGAKPHSDAVGLTILLQLNEMEGLQIKKDGMWILVKPLPNAFIINVGDILEMVTNGTYHSIEHRAIVNSAKERLSIATFYSPKLGGDIGPAPSLITPQKSSEVQKNRSCRLLQRLITQRLLVNHT
ncbi:unnamed protein product [Ilex paraguariensis]|uniref:Fe2OG dioxygenase domain-containing protein n=1 Tax=Ilex paraguariensis TaxID=185542 RepID=A0ABC8SI84_9AQUA